MDIGEKRSESQFSPSNLLHHHHALHGFDGASDLGGYGVGVGEGQVDLAAGGVGDAEGDCGAGGALDGA